MKPKCNATSAASVTEPMAVRQKPRCQLIGEDGNVFNVIGRVCRALKQNGMDKEAA